MSRFIKAELKSDSSDLEVQSEYNTATGQG